eukprot:795006-Pleurochrysis_carterae.AAC.1
MRQASAAATAAKDTAHADAGQAQPSAGEETQARVRVGARGRVHDARTCTGRVRMRGACACAGA